MKIEDQKLSISKSTSLEEIEVEEDNFRVVIKEFNKKFGKVIRFDNQ